MKRFLLIVTILGFCAISFSSCLALMKETQNQTQNQTQKTPSSSKHTAETKGEKVDLPVIETAAETKEPENEYRLIYSNDYIDFYIGGWNLGYGGEEYPYIDYYVLNKTNQTVGVHTSDEYINDTMAMINTSFRSYTILPNKTSYESLQINLDSANLSNYKDVYKIGFRIITVDENYHQIAESDIIEINY